MLARLRSSFATKGFDIVHPFTTKWIPKNVGGNLETLTYNGVSKEYFETPTEHHQIGFIVGNTSSIWKPFTESLQHQEQLPLHPLDDYVEKQMHDLTRHLPISDIYFTHDSSRIICFRKLANCTNLGHYSEDVGLCLHAKYGAWLAFRAVILLDTEDFDEDYLQEQLFGTNANVTSGPIEPLPFPGTEQEREQAAEKMKRLIDSNDEDNDWLSLRDTVSVGAKYKYEGAQLTYHYAPSRRQRNDVLKQFLKKDVSVPPQIKTTNSSNDTSSIKRHFSTSTTRVSGTVVPEPNACPKCKDTNGYWDGGTLFVCTACHYEWPIALEESEAADSNRNNSTNSEEIDGDIVDVNGNRIVTGDSVILVKDLAKGKLKKGLKCKLRVGDYGNGHDCQATIKGIGTYALKSQFLKKVK